MKEITSVQNEHIKNISKLHSSKGRKEQQQFLAEGQRALQSFAQAKWVPINLFAREDMAESAQELFGQAPIIVSEQVMNKISTATTPSGMIAVFCYPQTETELTAGLVLSSISDPGNMGTLIRSAVAFGSQSIVIVDGCDPFSPKVIQASAGTIAHIKLFRWSWEELIQNKKDLKLCALVIKDGQAPQDIKEKNLLLVVGNEAHGLTQSQIDNCDMQLTLPMNQTTESLNAAIAGSIALYLLK
jgi:RNA methyltransferase, TrmH family